MRWVDLFRKPKRSLEPVVKWAQKLPHWKKFRLKHLVALHKSDLAYAAVFKAFCLSGMIAISLVLAMRRWSFPSLSSRDPVPLHFLVALAGAGAVGVHSFALMETTLKPYEVAKTASFLLEVLAIFPQLIADRTTPPPTDKAASEEDLPLPEAEVSIGDRVEIDGIQARPQLNGMFGTVEGHSASGDRLNVKLENIEEETVALKPGNLKVISSQSKSVGDSTGASSGSASGSAGEGATQRRPAFVAIHFLLRAVASGIPILLFVYKSQFSSGPQDGGMKVLFQKYAGAAATLLYLQVFLGSRRGLVIAPIVIGLAWFGVMQCQSQGLIPQNRQLVSSAVAALPRILQGEAVVIGLLIISGGQPILTSFYAVILPMLIKAGMMESPFDPANVIYSRPTPFSLALVVQSYAGSQRHAALFCAGPVVSILVAKQGYVPGSQEHDRMRLEGVACAVHAASFKSIVVVHAVQASSLKLDVGPFGTC
eukprot:COSAG02_NODE_8221_length_2654_cov_1.570646_1_plen_481_part_00